MSNHIVIHKKQLDTLARTAPNTASLLHTLKTRHDPDPDDQYRFIILPCDSDDPRDIYCTCDSLDWELTNATIHSICEHCPHLSQKEQEQLIWRLCCKLKKDLAAIVQASARQAVEKASYDDASIPLFDFLEPEEHHNLDRLLREARGKAASFELNAFQLFLEGKLERLMPGDARLQAYKRLPEDKKRQVRQRLITNLLWETYYDANAGSAANEAN